MLSARVASTRGARDLVGPERHHVLLAPVGLHAQVHEQGHHRLHVADPRDVAKHDLLVGEQRCGKGRQRGVLVARWCDGPREGMAAFDDELLHAPFRGGPLSERLRKGTRGHWATDFGSRAGYPAPDGRERGGRRRPGTKRGRWCASGPSPIRSASTCSAWRRRCAPTRASSVRTRSSTPSPACSTTWTTSAIPTWTAPPATRARRSALFRERGYPDELIDAVAGHADFLEVPRETTMAKTLYAVDELSGFVAACALVRPTGIVGMTPEVGEEEAEAAELRRRRGPGERPRRAPRTSAWTSTSTWPS